IDIFSAPEEYARWAKSPDFAAKLDNRQRRSVVASVPPADMLYMPKSGNLEAKVRLADAQGNTIGERRAILKIKFGQGKEKRPLAGRWRNPLDFRVHEYIIR
ncbi:MAG: hypothetical protein LBH41_01475, partial [Rickettsiales bacterium]|nr:hypothetical protein [Rickettsiales bacterium]